MQQRREIKQKKTMRKKTDDLKDFLVTYEYVETEDAEVRTNQIYKIILNALRREEDGKP